MPTSRDVVEAFYAQRQPFPGDPPQGYFQWGGRFMNPQGQLAEQLQNMPPNYHPTFQGDPRQAWILTRPHQWGSAELPGMVPQQAPQLVPNAPLPPARPPGLGVQQQPGWPPGLGPPAGPPQVEVVPDPEGYRWGMKPQDI